MAFHTVQQGECLSTLAERYRLTDWRVLHEHPSNRELAALRKNPNILDPGDRVFIPEAEEKLAPCATGRSHRFVVERRSVKLHVVLKSDEGEAFAAKRFVVSVDGERIGGTTDGDGAVIVEVPVLTARCTLEVWLRSDASDEPDLVEELTLGHLDPVEEITGVQARLSSLGYACPVDGDVTEATRKAIARFRREQGLEPAGEDPIDAALRAKLVALHDGG